AVTRVASANTPPLHDALPILDEIARNREPVVFISGHFANWELMAAAVVGAGIDCLITYRAANNPYVDQRIREGRARYGVQLFARSEEHTSELQSRENLVCRLL